MRKSHPFAVFIFHKPVTSLSSFAKSRIAGSMPELLHNFRKDRRGAIAIIFALMIATLVTLVGGAVDYARWTSARAQTVSAMDAAVLAGGRVLQLGKPDSEVIAAAQAYYNQNKSQSLSVDLVTFTVENNRTEVRAVSNSRIQTPLLNVAGIPELKIEGTSRSTVSAGANSGSHIEISLMLDITGSMGYSSSAGGIKMDHLKAAAKDLIDIVVWQDQSEYTSRVAIAPFSAYVNVGSAYAADVTNDSNRKCIKERTNSNRYTDESPSSANGYFSGSTGSCGSEVVPLNSDKATLKTAIDALPTSGSTAGHLGTAWAWYLLSPKWASIWPTSSEPKPYTLMTTLNGDGQPLLRKIAVLMTDGEYNKKYNGDSSTTQARAICTNLKATGIEVYAVGFEISEGGEADTTMSQCATSPDHYYNASSGDALRSAFRDIALKISTLRISE